MKGLHDFELAGKKVLVRCDFNVPLDEKGNILDDFKILQTLPTLDFLVKNKARIVLLTHLGNPEGQVKAEFKIDNVRKKLAEYLGLPVERADDCVGEAAEEKVRKLSAGQILLLENLRFHPDEEKGDLDFAQELARLGEIYINDAFACCHRAHASLLAARFLPSGAGLLLEKEVNVLTRLRDCPQKPLVVILGGRAKGLETKLKLINRFASVADSVLLGGLVAGEMKRQNLQPGFPEKIVFPVEPFESFDIGSLTIKLFQEKISQAKTVFWSGPLGRIEQKEFSQGSLAIAQAIIQSRAFSVAGGGETIWFLKKQNLVSQFSHLSTGGDSLLLFLSGESLPGLEALA